MFWRADSAAARAILGAVVTLAVLSAASAAAAQSAAKEPASSTPAVSFREALEQGRFRIDLRYRVEFVDSGSFEKDALASTLRGAMSFETAPLRGFFAGVTFESITDIGARELHNNGGSGDTSNGVTDRPVIADPGLVEIDQAFVGYNGSYGVEIRGGRFDYVLDNQRFIGTAAWRQNRRSYDALSLAAGDPSSLTARYAYLGRARFNTGGVFRLDGHIVHASRDFGIGSLSGYAYLLDWREVSRSRRLTEPPGEWVHCIHGRAAGCRPPPARRAQVARGHGNRSRRRDSDVP